MNYKLDKQTNLKGRLKHEQRATVDGWTMTADNHTHIKYLMTWETKHTKKKWVQVLQSSINLSVKSRKK